MRDTNLVNALREHAEWAQANEWETPITLGDDLAEAADRLENQNAHIAALQQEIETLRGQNEQLREAAALVTKESAELLERRWIPVEAAEQWATAHPVKTRQSEFLKLFPYARVKKANGLPIVSPCDLDVKLAGECEGIPCQECWKDFWLAEVE